MKASGLWFANVCVLLLDEEGVLADGEGVLLDGEGVLLAEEGGSQRSGR